MPSTFSNSNIARVRRSLDVLSKELDKLDEGSEDHKRKIRNLRFDVDNIRTRFDDLMNILGFDDK